MLMSMLQINPASFFIFLASLYIFAAAISHGCAFLWIWGMHLALTVFAVCMAYSFNTANRRDIMDMGALISPYETKKCKNISKCIILFISIYPYHTFPLQFTSVFQTLYVVGSFLFMPSNPFILNLIQGVFIHKIQPLEARDNEGT